jgi:putative ABC transport system substrate-binding protein
MTTYKIMAANRRMVRIVVIAAALLAGMDEEALAQRLPVLGYVANENADVERVNAFRKGLADLGHVEGKNITIEYRYARLDAQYHAVIAELLARKVDIILAANAPAAAAAAKATRTVPIVLLGVNDPVGLRIAESLERPGRNVTGTTIYAPHLLAERVRILKTIVPALDHAGVICNANNANNPSQAALLWAAGKDLGIRIETIEVRSPEDVKPALDRAIASGVKGFFNCVDSLINSQRHTIAELVQRSKLPMIYTDREYVLAGGLMALGVGHLEGFYGAARYVDRILRGADPAELPIAPPTGVQFSVSKGALRDLGIALPTQISEKVGEWLP